MEATQLNVRISPELKARGDEALAGAGFTSSAAVRALWSLAVAYREDPNGLRAVLLPEEGRDNNEERQADIERRLRSLHEGWTICDGVLAQPGPSEQDASISAGEPRNEPSGPCDYKELYAEALYDSYRERGLL